MIKGENICKDSLSPDTCYRFIAIQKDDPDICNSILSSLEKDWCYQNIAAEREDSSLCNKIIDASVKEKCFEEATP